MNFIPCYALECQHPIGPHVHVICPEGDDLSVALLHMLGVSRAIKEEVITLKNLIQEGHAVSKTSIFPVQTMIQVGCEIFVICSMTMLPNESTDLKILLLKVDEEFGLPGIKVAEMFRSEINCLKVNEYGRN
jgi:hypothetical protein